MKTDTLKIVLDTNIILASISRLSPYRKIIEAFDKGAFDLFLDNEILFEYEEMINNHFGNKTSSNFINGLLAAPNAIFVESWFKLSLISTDSDDNKFVDCAFACNANFIITNDKHFNVLANINFPKITVLKIDEFMQLLESL